MIADWIAGLGAVLLQGWLLLLVALLVLAVAFLAGFGIGRRELARQIDERRAVVRRACEDAAVGRAPVPGQRGGER